MFIIIILNLSSTRALIIYTVIMLQNCIYALNYFENKQQRHKSITAQLNINI